MGLREVGPECDGLAIGGDGLIELSLVFQGNAKIVVRFGEVGPEGDGLAKGGDGPVELSSFCQGTAEIVVGFGKVGVKGDGLAIGGDGLIELCFILQGTAEITVGFSEVGLKGDGLPIGGDRLIELSFVFQGIAEMVVGVGEVGPEGDGPAKGGDGLIESPFIFQDTAEIAVGFGVVGVEGDGPTDQIHSNVTPSQLMGNQSQVVHRSGMLRLLGQDLPIKPLGLLQPPRLVVLQCQIEGVLDRELGHAVNGQYPTRITLSQDISNELPIGRPTDPAIRKHRRSLNPSLSRNAAKGK